MSKFHACLHGRLFKLIIPLFILFSPITGSAETDVEKDITEGLEQSLSLTSTIQEKLKSGAAITEEIKKLKGIAEEISASHMLLEDRFNEREERLKGTVPDLGTERSGVVESGLSPSKKALERHQAMKEGYQKVLREYLGLIESLSDQPSAVSKGTVPDLPAEPGSAVESGLSPVLEKLKTLLEKIVVKKKRPILGSLPYKNLNFPAKEPSAAPAIIPAYRGGNKTVAPEDTQGTEEAPISQEIASLAQGLNWQPVAIYEYVKNNIETEWYYGCMKGAEETLRQKSGNDCDQAALLVSLMRASGFPSRYVRGTMRFFAGGQLLSMDKARNLFGIDDPNKIAEFLQKAGIPFKPVIQGGKISNFEVEHIWVESLIPYANYRGAVIDEHGKTWLGLDTSIKVKWFEYNNAQDIFSGQWPVVSEQLKSIRDGYLLSPLLQGEGQGEGGVSTPLEYLKAQFTVNGLQFTDFLRTRTLPEEHLKILPSSMQIEPVKITNEYTEIPDELKHKVRITAVSGQQSALSEPMFDITLPTQKLSNQKVALSYEPETVEDQEIIDSYGGLDNTPAYLVRLRPVLKINGERMVVANDGLPMGSDYNLTIELTSPNGTESITNTHIVGNLAVIGITAQKVVTPSSLVGEGQGEGEKDAERLLYEAAQHYIDRWNQAEDELASLFHLAISRPVPTVVTLGGVIDVTYLLDMPHGFEWKGVFMDAGLRRIETTNSIPSPLAGEGQGEGDRRKLFMQLSALQGSVLENRIFEDDFKVESISTAKLFQQASSLQPQVPVIAIDKTNIDAILPTLPFDEAIKEDIINFVNQNLTIRIPQSELTYQNWSGIGYIKENTQTGEAGYMLSGMIAGGMTAVDKLQWYMQDIAALLSAPYTAAANTDPSSAVRIARLNSTDYQSGTAGKWLMTPFRAIALDEDGRPVKGVPVTFTAIAGGGELSGTDENGMSVKGTQLTVKTGWNGVADAYLTFGKHTSDSPYYSYAQPYYTLVGHNLISVSAQTGIGTLYTDKPFEAFGYPGEVANITKAYGDLAASHPNTFSGTIVVKVTDEYDNPISNKNVTFSVQPQQYLNATPPTGETKNAKIFSNLSDCPGIATLDCTNAVPNAGGTVTYIEKITDDSGALAYVILGNTDNTRYTIRAETQKGNTTINTDFRHYTWPLYRYGDNMTDPYLRLMSVQTVDEQGRLIDAGVPGSTFIKPLTAAMYYIEEDHEAKSCGTNCYYLKGKGTFTTTPVINGTVNFSMLQGGGSTNPPAQTTNTNGQYSTTYTIGNDPAKNIIKAAGTATVQTPRANQTTGLIEREAKQLSATTSFDIWGVKTAVEKSQLILINDEGYPTADTQIKYTIEPADYKSEDAFIDLYEKDETGNERWYGFVQADASGNITLSQGGAKFDANKTYMAELILNRGSKIEIRSEKTPLAIGQMKMFTTDLPETEVEGAVTDGVTKLKLRLTVKNNSILAGATWSIADPELSASSIQRGTLLDGVTPVDSWPVTFDANGVAEAVYKVPETFVRFETTEETNDKERAERYIQVKLGNISGLPNIRLKRPPVIVVHGLWSEPGTWKTFKSGINSKEQFIIRETNYQKTNAASLDMNYRVIPIDIGKVLDDTLDQRLAATKVDLVTHSMGGLITREYCRQESLAGRNCKDQIHKLITIDTPHTGSELANLLVATTQQPDSKCFKMLPEIEKTDKKIWADPQHTAVQGGLIDLSVGSQALHDLPYPPSDIPFTAVYGISTPVLFAHTNELNMLWAGLMWYCGKVPDSSYLLAFSGLDAVFSENNDRIVSYTSERGSSTQYIQITGVDHISVLQSLETVRWVKETLEKQ